MIDPESVARCDGYLGLYLRALKPAPRRKVRPRSAFIFLLVVPAFWFLLFWAATSCEDRFWLGSVGAPVLSGGQDRYLGTSFLGDTMVWPYFFMIPFILVMLKVAIYKTADFLNTSFELGQLLSDAEAALQYRGRWRFWRAGAGCLGIFFFLFNTATVSDCDLCKGLRPSSDTPTVVPHAVTVTFEKLPPMTSLSTSENAAHGLPPYLAGRMCLRSELNQLEWRGPVEKGMLATLSPSEDWQRTIDYSFNLKTKAIRGPKTQRSRL